jgi:class 3 adenylate cyclase/tetratricopeptide (TPR) repeat protein
VGKVATSHGTMPSLPPGYGEILKPYVPRLLLEWTRDRPHERYRTIEGSLVFVDVSGFTALTERLARRGQVGAEILRDTLDGLFRGLLDEAYAWGGGLLKWGGDALLLFYDGDEHIARAARAAWEMQQRLERSHRSLRMSVGIASGNVDFVVAGRVHRELLVLGPVATETVLVESAAEAGEVRLSAAAAAQLDPAVTVDGLLVAPPEAPAERSPSVGRVDDEQAASCIPVAAREHVLLERPEPEHRTITAAFLDLMRTDELLAELGPDALAAALDELLTVIEESALRHGVPFNVTDVSKGSIKVLLTAGAPSSTGHDEEQTLRVVREVLDHEGVVPVRAGVSSGRVFTGDFGPPYRRTYAVFGDAVNTAARVMARSESGLLLATDEVLERSRTTFATTPVEPFRAKGKAEPVRAALVGAITGRRSDSAAATPLVGRERELAALRAAFEQGGLVEVSGPSGIGKSRLVRELLAGTPALTAECAEYEASTPYFAVRTLLRELLGIVAADAHRTEERLRAEAERRDLLPWLPLLGILLGLDLPSTPESDAIDDRFLADKLAEVGGRLLEGAVLAVEDVQHIDDASVHFLRAFLRDGGTVVTTHSDPARTWVDDGVPHLAMTLRPLPEEHAVRLVELATDEVPLRPHEVEAIAARSGGSPLFLLELLGVARTAGGVDALPESVEAIATAEIDRLAPGDRIVLRLASVLGTTFDRALLESVTALDAGALERVAALLFPTSDGRMRFRTALVRDAAYEGLSYRRRRELHARAAEAIELLAESLDDEAATLALHYSAARRHAETWHYARLGGDRARSVAANVEAARLYELALAAARFVPDAERRERASVLVDLGTVRETAGLFDASYDALRRATDLLADDPVEQARVFARRTRARVRVGAYSRALAETARGLRAIDGREGIAAVAARATLLAMRSEIRMFQGRARQAIPLALEAVEEAQRAEELEALAHAYTALDGSYQLLGQPERAVHERMALDIYRSLGQARLSGVYGLNVGVQAYADGRWDEAAELYARAQEDCLRAGDRQNAALAGTNLGELLISRGRLDEAEELLADARRVLRSSGYAAFALFAEVQLARCRLERGDADGALTLLDRIAVEAVDVGYAALVLEAGVYLAHAHVGSGSPAAGLAALESAVAAGGDDAALYRAAVERARAACLVALGRRDDAVPALDSAVDAAVAQQLLYEELLARRARASLVEPPPEELHEIERLEQLLRVPVPA